MTLEGILGQKKLLDGIFQYLDISEADPAYFVKLQGIATYTSIFHYRGNRAPCTGGSNYLFPRFAVTGVELSLPAESWSCLCLCRACLGVLLLIIIIIRQAWFLMFFWWPIGFCFGLKAWARLR